MITLTEKRNWSCASVAAPIDEKREFNFDKAYELSLELCNDPKTASRVATRFIEDVQASDEAPTEKETSNEK